MGDLLNNLQSSVRLIDLLDVGIVAFIVYRVLLLIKGTRAMQMLTGLGILGIGFFLSSTLELFTTHWLLSYFFDYLILIVIVVFQDDMRRALTHVGKNPFFSASSVEEEREMVNEIARAATRLASERIGGLIVLERETGLKNFIDTGSKLESRVKTELLYAIFITSSPIHDGAVIIREGRIAAAGCFLPLSKDPNIDKRYGTRHRAALGLTEDTDAIVVLISEEAGEAHLVRNGKITTNLSEQELKQSLGALLDLSRTQVNLGRKMRGLFFSRPAKDGRLIVMERFFEKLTFHIWSFFTVNIGTKLVSIAIAVVLWVVVLGSRNVEVTKEIPLEVITPGELVPSNDIPDRIAFRLSGPKAFLRAILDRREEPIRVNLSGAKPGLVTYRFFSDNIRVPIGVKVLSINPTAILIKLESVKRREVPVHAQLQGSPAEGFHVVDQELKPATVKIKGAESRVEAVTEVATVPIDLTGANKPIETPVSLDLSRYNVQLDSPAPRLSVDIQPVAANYRIKGVDVRVLSSFKVKMDEKTVTVLVRAGSTQLTELDREHVYAVVDLRGKPKGHYTPSVKVTLPEEVGLVKVIPEHVDVTLY